MIVYWTLFLFPSLLAFFGKKRNKRAYEKNFPSIDLLWFTSILVLTFIIGLRFEVGGDWVAYLKFFEISQNQSIFELLSPFGDPGYRLINSISGQLGFGIYGVNLFSALIFSLGLSLFCNSLPRPMLALAVSIPYMVVVVSMGYSRQALALGIAMIALVGLGKGKQIFFVFLVLIAATIHKSAVLLLPIVALASSKQRIWTFIWLGIIAAIAYFIFLADAVSTLIKHYVEESYQSQGAFIRLVMCAIPAAILLIWPHRFHFPQAEKKIWQWFAIISIGLFILLFLTDASTAIDRLALYLLPLQLVVFSYLPDMLGERGELKQLLIMLIILYYSAVLFVWLNFAFHSYYWLPYKNILIS
tara:strand:- start:14 stop:1087 length:1074 start_codon:yes stop_codon:yes gene_type:complete